jgi:hypothetical protein
MMARNGSSNKLQSVTEPAPHHGKKYGLFNASNNGDTFSLQFLSPSIRAPPKSGHGVELSLRLTTLVGGDRVRPFRGALSFSRQDFRSTFELPHLAAQPIHEI